MTPAEQIRAALEATGYGMGRGTHRGHWEDRRSVAGDGWVSEFVHNKDCEVCAALAALDALEAEHADRVWLTRDEAKQIDEMLLMLLNSVPIRRTEGAGVWSFDDNQLRELRALLDERIGDKP